MAYVIAEPCIDVKDKACVEVCSVDRIYEGSNQLFIHPDEWIDCGACEPVCPVKAIFAEDEMPEQWRPFIALNKQFFVDNPGSRPPRRTEWSKRGAMLTWAYAFTWTKRREVFVRSLGPGRAVQGATGPFPDHPSACLA